MPKKLNNLLLLLFVFTTLSGVLRKWIFPSTAIGNIVFGIIFLFPLLFLLYDFPSTKKIFSNKMFLFYLTLLLIEAFNPLNLTLYHGILGIILHGYIWFLLVLYLENRDTINLKQYTPVFLMVVVLETVLGFIQSQLPPEHFLNRYADVEKVGGTIASIGDAVRISGTFSYLGGFTGFMIFYIFLAWYLFKINFQPIVTLSCFFTGMLLSFMTGSRSVTYIYFSILTFFIITEFFNLKDLKLSRIFPAIIILVLIFVLNGNLGTIQEKVATTYQNFDDRRQSLAENGEEKERITEPILGIVNFSGSHPLFGVGLGATYQGATGLFGTSDYVKEYGYYESEGARIILEGGFLLYLARAIMCVYIVSLLKVPKLGKVLFFLLLIYFISYSFNIYNAIYLAFGIMLIDSVYYKKVING